MEGIKAYCQDGLGEIGGLNATLEGLTSRIDNLPSRIENRMAALLRTDYQSNQHTLEQALAAKQQHLRGACGTIVDLATHARSASGTEDKELRLGPGLRALQRQFNIW